jgi:predicted nucleic acid-binding protein
VKVFFDTNILIYAQQSCEKADTARTLLAGGGKISVQVLNEFAAVAHRKLAKGWSEIEAALADVLDLVDPPAPLTLEIHEAARALARDHGVSFYDALIIAAALATGSEVLFSEDLQDGRSFGGLKIVNPFR